MSHRNQRPKPSDRAADFIQIEVVKDCFDVVATLIFHQIRVLLLHYVGMIQHFLYNMRPAPPIHVPQFISLSRKPGKWKP